MPQNLFKTFVFFSINRSLFEAIFSQDVGKDGGKVSFGNTY